MFYKLMLLPLFIFMVLGGYVVVAFCVALVTGDQTMLNSLAVNFFDSIIAISNFIDKK